MWAWVCVVIFLYSYNLFVDLLWMVLQFSNMVDQSVAQHRKQPVDLQNSEGVRFVFPVYL